MDLKDHDCSVNGKGVLVGWKTPDSATSGFHQNV